MPLLKLGKGQRGQTQPDSFGCYGFTGGLNVKAAPDFVGDKDLTQAYNGYLRADGGFQMRNGMTSYGNLSGAGTVQGIARFFQEIVGGSPSTNVVTVCQAGSSLVTSTNSSIGSIGSNNPMTWVRAQDPNDPNISGLTDVLVVCSGSGGPYVYDGTNLYTPAGWSSAAGAKWCCLVNGVIWFGGISATPNQIFGTGTGQSGDASMETLPASRNFVFSGPVTGLAAQGTGATAALVVGMNNGISVLSGTGYTNYFLQDIPMQDGVAAGRTMVYYNGVMYWLGRSAVWAFDGQSQPVRISDKIEPWILNDAFIPGYPMTGNRNLSWAQIYNNKLHIGYCTQSATTPNAILVFDLTLRGWTVLQSTPGAYCMSLLDAPSDPSPATAVIGSSVDKTLWNWDVEPSAGGVARDGTTEIMCQFQTKFYKLGVPGTNKMLLRTYPELFLSGPLAAEFTVATDYGNAAVSEDLSPSFQGGSNWGQFNWDVDDWSSGQVFFPFGPPDSRIDWSAIQAESFAFGMNSFGNSGPWLFQGLTGSFSQKAAT